MLLLRLTVTAALIGPFLALVNTIGAGRPASAVSSVTKNSELLDVLLSRTGSIVCKGWRFSHVHSTLGVKLRFFPHPKAVLVRSTLKDSFSRSERSLWSSDSLKVIKSVPHGGGVGRSSSLSSSNTAGASGWGGKLISSSIEIRTFSWSISLCFKPKLSVTSLAPSSSSSWRNTSLCLAVLSSLSNSVSVVPTVSPLFSSSSSDSGAEGGWRTISGAFDERVSWWTCSGESAVLRPGAGSGLMWSHGPAKGGQMKWGLKNDSFMGVIPWLYC